jgi:WhiB family redox-sensing transcriptional regulator
VSADPDLFFPISTGGKAVAQIAQARRICAGCQVRRQCLDFALEIRELEGIWGGTTLEEREHAPGRRAGVANGVGHAFIPLRSASPARRRARGLRGPLACNDFSSEFSVSSFPSRMGSKSWFPSRIGG